MTGQHGSTTDEELLVPLLVARRRAPMVGNAHGRDADDPKAVFRR
ncbi:MAG TPA: hypothetical protein VG674_14795 [Amycolatopsis sp.]|jgi:hypothetical protein|nr:hypothetical protein [Amycolatopsis sp.]